MYGVRLAIMGTGKIARGVTPRIQEASGCVVTCVASRDAARARAFADDLGIVGACTYDELRAREDVDAVYVTLPNSDHPAWAERLVRAGKHVLCEKPLCWTLAQAERLFAASAASGRTLVEAFTFEHCGLIGELSVMSRSSVDGEGELGRLRRVEAEFEVPIVSGPSDNVRCSRALAGGATMDLGCYPVGFARLMTGEELADAELSVQGGVVALNAARPGEDAVDAWTRATGAFPSGVEFDLRCSMVLDGRVQARLIFDRGVIDVPDFIRPVSAVVRAGASTRELTGVGGGDAYRVQAEAFARACRGAGDATPSPAWSIGQAAAIERVLAGIGLAFDEPLW